MPETVNHPVKTPTVLSSWTQVLVKALRERGVDTDRLVKAAGLDPDSVNVPDRRFPLQATTRLWQLAVTELDNESLGLWVSRYSTHTSFHALGYAFMASRTLRDAMERVVRYNSTVSDAASVTFEDRSGRSLLSWSLHPGGQQPAFEAMEAVIAAILRACRRLSGPGFSPRRVQLLRPAPADQAPFAEFFRCELAFGGSVYVLEFDSGELDRPLAAGNEDLARTNDRAVEDYLARLELGTVASRLRTLLARQLPSGVLSHEEYAEMLGMSGRSLQRKLNQESTSFNQVLGETRCDLARSYLAAQPRHSLAEIAFLLGFSDTSSFSRAFHRWTGKSPSRYASAL